jgi:hypothetical protein
VDSFFFCGAFSPPFLGAADFFAGAEVFGRFDGGKDMLELELLTIDS